MDKVRFGRALGYGARHAAKSFLAAADAAASPAPARPTATSGAVPETPDSPTAPRLPSPPRAAVRSSFPKMPATPPTMPAAPPTMPAAPTASSPSPHPVQQILRGAAQVHEVRRQAGRQARSSFLAPFAKFSTVVSLQVTGTFFALIALIMSQAVWRSRAALRLGAGNPDARRVYLVAAVGLLFAYFALSNFLRARHRDRRS